MKPWITHVNLLHFASQLGDVLLNRSLSLETPQFLLDRLYPSEVGRHLRNLESDTGKLLFPFPDCSP